MSDWRQTLNSAIYQEALSATESIEEPPCGFVKPRDTDKTTTAIALIKQNNTLIQLLVKIKEDLEDCKDAIKDCREAIKRIEAAKTPAVHLNNTIEELQKGLQNLKFGERKTPKEKVPFTYSKTLKPSLKKKRRNESNQNSDCFQTLNFWSRK
jgi:hypothetical protein